MPYVMELPAIDRLHRSVDSEDVAFVLVASAEREVARDFLGEKDWGFPVYLVEDEVPESLTNEIIPFTLIVDPEGTIRFEHEGAVDYDTDPTREFLRGLAGRASI